MEQNKIVFLVFLCFVGGIKKCHSEIATCNPLACKNSACSSNVDCEYLSTTNNSISGICGALVLSCTSVVRCNLDNRTCPIENTICVNNTRCQYPVCYPLALADKLVCSPLTTITTPATTTSDVIDISCPLDQIPSITAGSNLQIDFYTKFQECPLCVEVSVGNSGGIYNVCAIRQLTINGYNGGVVTMGELSVCPKHAYIAVAQSARIDNVCSSETLSVTAHNGGVVTLRQLSVCPNFVNISAAEGARVDNVCSSETLSVTAHNSAEVTIQQSSVSPKFVQIAAAEGAHIYNVSSSETLSVTAHNSAEVTIQQSSVCPRFVNISVGESARVYNVCITEELRIQSDDGSTIILIDYKQFSTCPKIVEIFDVSSASIFSACVTQTVNARLGSIAK